MKTIPLLALLLTSAALGAEPPAVPAQAALSSCCTEPAPAAAPFSRDSLYQLAGRFTADSGAAFTLGSLRGRPVVLDLFYASCSSACPLAVTEMLTVQQRLPALLRARTVFVLVSFDSAHDTPAVLARYRAQRQLDGHWVLLHGDDDSVRELSALVGVQYKQDVNGAFSHTNLLTVLNARGEIVHQREGLTGGLDEVARSLAAAVNEK